MIISNKPLNKWYGGMSMIMTEEWLKEKEECLKKCGACEEAISFWRGNFPPGTVMPDVTIDENMLDIAKALQKFQGGIK